jgi:hypothetical protein
VQMDMDKQILAVVVVELLLKQVLTAGLVL